LLDDELAHAFRCGSLLTDGAPMSDAVPLPIRAVLDLYADELAAVKFPDLDATVLRAAADAAIERADDVARAEAALEEARVGLAVAQEGLLLKAQRALAYAKVFAEDDAALTAKLEALTLPRAPRRAAPRGLELQPTAGEAQTADQPGLSSATPAQPKRRGRPPKALIATSAPLFGPLSESEPRSATTESA